LRIIAGPLLGLHLLHDLLDQEAALLGQADLTGVSDLGAGWGGEAQQVAELAVGGKLG
jgi:hypothetical protein